HHQAEGEYRLRHLPPAKFLLQATRPLHHAQSPWSDCQVHIHPPLSRWRRTADGDRETAQSDRARQPFHPSGRRGQSARVYPGDKEEQEIAEACNRLVKNAIVCWNYLLLEHRLSQAPSDEAKAEIRAAVANHSIISWAHINLLGE